MVIADNLSVYVDEIYASPSEYNSRSIIIGLIFYSFQIYSDFYGYSIIAIGSAKLIGINLMDNFNTPYLARNINEFWQRWHISLSTWFRDYMYIPLGGNRVKLPRWLLNILLVFLISGLWHGANWTFVIWGGIFGIAYLVENFWNRLINNPKRLSTFKLWHVLLIIKTFIIVTFAWIFFRSENLDKAFEIFKAIGQNWEVKNTLDVIHFLWIFFAFFIVMDIFLYNSRFDIKINKFAFPVRWLIYMILMYAIIFYCGVEDFPFIYFQF
jgi:D-alanyl-lipoteichoic acid acyltransferase DltB (MBOAT superfamily)